MAKTRVFYKPKKKRTPTKARGKVLARKVKRKIKLIVFALFAVGISTLILTGVSFYNFANAPFSGAANTDYSDTDSVWKEDETNLVVVRVNDLDSKTAEIDALYLVNFDANNYRYAIYKIPVNEDIDYALNYGRGPLKDIYSVGNADQNRGLYLLEKTLLKQLAVKVDGYVVVDDEGSGNLLGMVNGVNPNDLSASLRLKNWPKMPSLIADFREVALTNLKLSDIYSIVTFIRNTSETSSTYVELTRYQLLEDEKWDTLWRGNQSLSPVKHEGIKVFVANASSPRISGLAGWGSRVAQNVGASVLEADNSFVEFDENMILTDDPELVTVKKLANSLGITKVIHTNDLNRDLNYNPQIFRTPVTLVLVNGL